MKSPNSVIRRYLVLISIALFVLASSVASGDDKVKFRKKPPFSVTPSGSSSLEVTLQPVVTTLSSPVLATNAGDGTNRLFIVEQAGIIKVLQPGSSTPTVFLNITAKVLDGGERGLLGLAFHPNYETNRRFFVYYTRETDGALVTAEYTASAANPNVADTAEIVILTIPHPNFGNHNGGSIEFGQDGFLYLGPGDGGSGNDPPNNAQNINALLGKILRIDIDTPNGAIPYSSPPSNPFFGATPGRDEIYAVGMRNPFRFSFDRMTGALLVGDVGQGVKEEIDNVTLGGNYGWRVFEGTRCTNLDPPLCSSGSFIPPIAEYDHTPGQGGRCAVLGGYAYRGTLSTFPAGAYVYGDLCTGEVFLLEGGQQSLILDTNNIISSFGEDEAGELYLVELGSTVFRFVSQVTPDVDTIALYDPAHGGFFLRNSNNSGVAHSTFTYGPGGAGLIGISGDWNGDGVDTPGLYNPVHGAFFLRNSNTSGIGDTAFNFNPAGMGAIPIVGDWNGDGVDTVGLYNPGTATFFLRNSNSSGSPDITFAYGGAGAGLVAITGDWNGDGMDTIGLYAPSGAGFFLRNSNTSGVADITFTYGGAGAGLVPLVGDWNGDGVDTIGLYDPAHAGFFLRNSNNGGVANVTFNYGGAGAGLVPLLGDWDGL